MSRWFVLDADGVPVPVEVDGDLVVLDNRRLTTGAAETLRGQLAAAIREARDT
jgi:hypothetical protein